MNLLRASIVFCVFAACFSVVEAADEPQNQVNKTTIAIIDFESKAPGNPELGKQISDILTARLSIYDEFELIERQKIEELIKEHELNLTGMVETSQAISVGKMLGAKIMIFGRAFVVDKDIYMVAKLVGTETTIVKGVMAKGKLEGELSDVIDQLVEKLTEGLEKWANNLLPPNEKLINRITVLKEKLKGKKLPCIAVSVPEDHINRILIDPAAETEIKKVLKEVGFEIIEIKGNDLPQWVKDFQKDPQKSLPSDISTVDVLITGEGLSEYGTRIGGLISCTARLELNAIDLKTRKIINVDRTTKRAVDLTESIASKTALQASGNELAINFIEKIAEQLEKK